MTSTPSGGEPGPTDAQLRRRLLGIGLGLFLPIILIWFAAATVVARGLRFPPALAYSTSGKMVSGQASAAADTRPLRELLDASAGEITLRQDGTRPLNAWLAPAAGGEAAVVLIYPNAVGAQPLAAYFKLIRAAGYAALVIDNAGSYGFGYAQRAGVLDAIVALRARGVRRIALLGVSEGAAAALFAGVEAGPLAAIVSDSSYAELGALMRRIPPLDSLNPGFDRTVLWELGLMLGRPIDDLAPARAAARLTCPLMLIAGADDPLTPPSDARKIFAAARGPKQLWIVPGAGHAAALATDPDEYAHRVGAFLTQHLGAPATRGQPPS
jgi:uncharacterized protein